MTVFYLLGDKSVIYITVPQLIVMGAELMALTSNSSMNRLAMMGLMGELMAASWICSNTYPGRGCRYFKAKLQEGNDLGDCHRCPLRK